ncbi:BglG family transcription antiterminator [Paenibacillus xylaniclasticus]|uniref:BglG family transcription antiterminator n=1 Tax=Paenibacillus xylaniclasticus TaxID=588083 RepID=UPI000FD8AF9A|nr:MULTISPECIES: PRD domain-containing protein [Paenibacillus]GFN30132.1 sugar transporter [Paenibacillus curdlanolyticus]
MISSRQQRLLKQLIEADDYITLQQISEMYNISDRTVRHDLLNLEDWLRKHGVLLIRHRVKGVKLQHEMEQLQLLKQEIHQHPDYMDSKQRITSLLKLLLKENNVSMEQIIEDYRISKSTLLTDLNEIKIWLQERRLTVHKSRGILSVTGSEQAMRRAYLELLRTEITEDKLLRYMFDRNEEKSKNLSPLYIWFKAEDVEVIFNALQSLEAAMRLQFSDTGYTTVTLHILMAMERIKHRHSIEIDSQLLEELQESEMYHLIENHITPMIEAHFKVKLPASEIGYITQHMLGAQKQRVPVKDLIFVNLAEEIIRRTEDELGYRLKLSEQVIQGLAIHLKPAVYRAKFNLQSKNPLLAQLEQQYGSLLNILERVVNEVIRSMSISFGRDEIGYILLHVASGIVPQVMNVNKRVIIVCGSGVGTSALIKQRLSFIFPQLEVVRTCSYKDAVELTAFDTDAVLSTVDIGHSLPIPWLKVSPLLTAKDQRNIADYFGLPYKGENVTALAIQSVNSMIKIIERNASIHNRNKLVEDLLFFLQGGSVGDNESANSLVELLPVSSIKLQIDSNDWEAALRYGSQLLIDRGASGIHYEQKLVDMVNSNKHSFLIHEGVYFPHAYMPEDVMQTAFSLVTFKEPILFGPSKHPVWLMIILAAIDKERHIAALSTLLEALNDAEFMSCLRTAMDANEIWERLHKREVQ